MNKKLQILKTFQLYFKYDIVFDREEPQAGSLTGEDT